VVVSCYISNMAEQKLEPVVHTFVFNGTIMYVKEGETLSATVLEAIPRAISDTMEAIKDETDNELKAAYSKGLKHLRDLSKDK
jgi:hypothetical protein